MNIDVAFSTLGFPLRFVQWISKLYIDWDIAHQHWTSILDIRYSLYRPMWMSNVHCQTKLYCHYFTVSFNPCESILSHGCSTWHPARHGERYVWPLDPHTGLNVLGQIQSTLHVAFKLVQKPLKVLWLENTKWRMKKTLSKTLSWTFHLLEISNMKQK